jgi:Zn-finger nucleic acid-binding protein/ribosomal protein L40E
LRLRPRGQPRLAIKSRPRKPDAAPVLRRSRFGAGARMQLIACSNCHTQYDVSSVLADTITCRCGEQLENKPLQAVDARVRRCGACGAQVDADARSCAYCGSSIVRDQAKLSLICPECYARNEKTSRFCTACGVAFNPEPIQVEGRERNCPDCTLLMPVRQVAGIALNECTECNGLWVPGESFDVLVTRAAESFRSRGQEHAPPAPRVTGANPAQQKVRYRKCPDCDAFMQRRNYHRSSGIIIDVCRDHGTWLDADELEGIAGFIASGSHPSPTLAAGPERSRAESDASIAFAQAIAQRERVAAHGSAGVGDVLAGGLLGILTRLLS